MDCTARVPCVELLSRAYKNVNKNEINLTKIKVLNCILKR